MYRDSRPKYRLGGTTSALLNRATRTFPELLSIDKLEPIVYEVEMREDINDGGNTKLFL